MPPTALVLAVLSLLLWLAAISLFVSFHLRGTGYSPVRHAVSDYGVGPTRRAFTVYTWIGNAGALAFAGALWTAGRSTAPAWLLALLVGWVIARAGVAIFPTDLEGQRTTRAGLLHYAFAIVSFAAAYTAIRNLTPRLAPAAPIDAVRGALVALAWFATPALVANCVAMARPLRRVFGLCERAFLATVLLWFATASGALALALR